MRREEVGGKPAKTGGDGDAAAKERPEEAPFVALRPHDYRLRTWNRTPAASEARGHALIKIKIKKLRMKNKELTIIHNSPDLHLVTLQIDKKLELSYGIFEFATSFTV